MKNKGFSLIELIMVAVILVVIISLGLPKISKTVGRGKEAATQADITSLMTALDLYKGDVKVYPNVLDKLKSDTATGWKGPYVHPDMDFKDSWGSIYKYVSNSTTYSLYSFGPNQSDDGGLSDDIKYPF